MTRSWQMSNIVIQSEVDNSSVPDSEIISDWAFAVLKQLDDDQRELTIRIVDQQEMTSLNESYRGKPGVTNVLSFPFENPPGIDAGIIGDIAICADVVGNEAAEQDKSALSHWAHMVVHGTLHL
ncbi:MAG: putative rRNA maturation factor, partial [Gammaproteobacteria bacterium]